MNASDWIGQVQAATEKFFPDLPLSIQILRETRVKIRIDIDEEAFADLFFREETKRYDYSLIIADTRRFGVDNLSGWHMHPTDAPDSHIPTSEPTPEDALRMLSEAADKLNL